MKRYVVLFSLVATSAALAQTATPSPDLMLSSDSGCAGEISRFRVVQENDYASGNVAKSVYLQIKRELDAAEKLCAGGQDATASALIHASEARHGYSTHL